MRVINDIEKCCEVKNPVVTIGTFDGLHLGHQQLLRQLINMADKHQGESLVITFWPHPKHVLATGTFQLRLLNSLEEKKVLLRKAGIDNLLIIPFTKAFSKQQPDEFINDLLVNKIGAKGVVIGYDHRFGKNREGSFEYLRKSAKKHGFEVQEVDAFQLSGVSVSSTKIRKALAEGRILEANKMLGYAFFIKGSVGKGLGLGKKLRFPTANVQVDEEKKMLPSDGVYVCQAEVGEKMYKAILNVGQNPTIEGKGRSVEVHIIDFEGNLYNQEISIYFLKKLRAEKKFGSKEDLSHQLSMDKANALSYFESLEK